MFLNYQNVSNNYTPNNLTCSFPVRKSETKLAPLNTSKPYEEYDAKGKLIGYRWYQGETLNLEFTIDGEITVETDAIILSSKGSIPSSSVGKLNQRAYNIIDLRSWTCTSIVNNIRTWTMDSEFTYPEQGNSLYITAAEYLKDKKVEVKLYNFRQESIYSKIFDGNTTIIFPIDKELSNKLVKGVYYCSLTVFNDTVTLPIFSVNDCTLLVK